MYSVPPLYSARPILWLPPKVWCQGSQSSSTGGASATKGKASRSICWLEQIMRCVLTTPLGCPVDPEVNRIFAGASGSTFAAASATAGAGVVASNAAKSVAPGAALRVETTSTPGGTAPAMAAAKRAPSLAKTMPGVSSERQCRSFTKSLASSE
jgi:hypothetical protein